MSEGAIGAEQNLRKAVSVSVAYAENTRQYGLLGTSNIEEAGEIRNRLYKKAGAAAERLSRVGVDRAEKVWGDMKSVFEQIFWKVAAGMTNYRLNKEPPQVVWQTLNAIDPQDVKVNITDINGRESGTLNIRRSMGMVPDQEIIGVAGKNIGLLEQSGGADKISIQGLPFRPEAIRGTLEARGKYKPGWRENGVLLPLINNMTGEVFLFDLDNQQLTEISALIETANERQPITKKNEINGDETLKEKMVKLFEEPLSDCEKTISKNRANGRRCIIPTSAEGEPVLVFQGRTYGEPTENDSSGLHRVYFQVEKEDIPETVEMMKNIGEQRAARGKGLNFKFIVGAIDQDRFQSSGIEGGVGDLDRLTESDPRVVAFFDSETERAEFIRELLSSPQRKQKVIEMSRKRKNPDGSFMPRRPGSSSVYDTSTGEELRAINYTLGGYSEDVIGEHGPKWREWVFGSKTGYVKIGD